MATTPAGDCWKNKIKGRGGTRTHRPLPLQSSRVSPPSCKPPPPPLAYERGLLSPEEGVYERLYVWSPSPGALAVSAGLRVGRWSAPRYMRSKPAVRVQRVPGATGL